MLPIQNQFSQIPVQGQIDLNLSPGTVSVEIDSSQSTPLVAGQSVKLVDSAGGVPKVIACAADDDDVYGFIAYTIKDQNYPALSKAEVALVNGGDVMYMTASAAIARGASVAIVLGSGINKVMTATTGQRLVGQAFDKAAADGDLIRVLLLPKAGLSA